MPPTLSKPSSAAPTALFYITVGALMTVWSGIWYSYLRNHNSDSQTAMNYLCLGFLITGLVLLAIGFTLGPIARWSRHAELPPIDSNTQGVRAEPPDTTTRNI